MINLYKYGSNHPMTFRLSRYAENDNLYVGLITTEEGYAEPWSDLTVNLSVPCDENCSFIDTNNNGDEIIDWLTSNNLGKLTGKVQPSGWCMYPEFEFNMEELGKHIKEEIK